MSDNSAPWRDKRLLERLFVIEGQSKSDVAERFGCATRTVTDWVKNHEISLGHDCPDDNCHASFRNERQLNLHHTKQHGENVEVKCEQCGTVDEYIPSEADRRFCGNSCRNEWMKTWTGENHPRWERADVECEWCGSTDPYQPAVAEGRRFCSTGCRNGWLRSRTGKDHPDYSRIEFECDWCGKENTRWPSRMETSILQFCDGGCYGQWRGENISGAAHPQYKERVITECEWCGVEKSLQPSMVREHVFCDHTCYGCWLSENWSGKNSPHWKGGVSGQSYGPSWQPQRAAALARDRYVCQDSSCSVDRDTHYDEFGHDLHVHHLTPFRLFDHHKEANRLDNLVSLCLLCHQKWESMAPLRPDTRNT